MQCNAGFHAQWPVDAGGQGRDRYAAFPGVLHAAKLHPQSRGHGLGGAAWQDVYKRQLPSGPGEVDRTHSEVSREGNCRAPEGESGRVEAALTVR